MGCANLLFKKSVFWISLICLLTFSFSLVSAQPIDFLGWLGNCDTGTNCDITNLTSFGFLCNDDTCTNNVILASNPNAPGINRFHNPQHIATDSTGNLYITDIRGRLFKFSPSGVFLGWFGNCFDDAGSGVCDPNTLSTTQFCFDCTPSGANGTTFGFPSGVAVDSFGNIYVTDITNQLVLKFNSFGIFLGWIGNCNAGSNCDTVNKVTTQFCSNCTAAGITGLPNEFREPMDIAFDSEDNFYVVDNTKHNVKKFNSNGVLQFMQGTSGFDNGKFLNPQAVAVDSSDNFYVGDTTNNRVQAFDKFGNFFGWFGNCIADAGSGICDTVNQVTLQLCNDCISTLTVGSGSGQFNLISGIDLDASNNIYVSEGGTAVQFSNNRVQKFGPNGNFIAKFGRNGGDGTEGTADGEFREPNDVIISGGSIYVLDTFNNRVQKLNDIGLSPDCFDTDGGRKYFTKGTVTLPFSIASDICNSNSNGLPLNGNFPANAVAERYCEDNTAKTEYFVCENGCFNGACLNAGTCGDGVINGTDSCDGSNLGGASCQSLGFDTGTLGCSNTCGFDTSSCFNFVCGDGVVNGTDSCDGANLAGKDCTDFGFASGTLGCSNTCGFDTSSCFNFVCGDGAVTGGEVCDGTNLAGKDCTDFGFDAGALGCDGSCCSFDTSSCFNFVCGDDVINGSEVCDGSNLSGATCESLGFDSGTLGCAVACGDFDTSSCVSFVCGDGVVNGVEVCDGVDLGGASCVSQGFDSGTLGCAVACGDFDTSSCVSFVCGDGVVNGVEVCDGVDLGGESCVSQGFDSGVLGCSNVCGLDKSNCVNVQSSICGNGIIEGDEVCDRSNFNGETCESLGFDGGSLACNASCKGFVPAGCVNHNENAPTPGVGKSPKGKNK